MTWEIDATHSQVTFAIKHMMIVTVKGHFNVFRGKLNIDEENPEKSWVEAEADASSIDTRDKNRDNHLRSPDFFDVQQYPTITFKSTKVEHTGDHEYKIIGDLTLHGVTKEVIFQTEYSGQVKDTYGLQRAGLSAKTTIDRKDFGLSWHQALETGGVLVGDDVKIEIDLSAVNKG